MKIKDILSIDLSEDIKSVIDIQQFSETEIIQEIDNYIITDGLAREYSKFVSTFTSNILETGVWISGFTIGEILFWETARLFIEQPNACRNTRKRPNIATFHRY